MTEEKNQIEKTQTKVELQLIPCTKRAANEKVAALNHESQDDPCVGKIILSVICDGAKLTKADAGVTSEYSQEIWVTAKLTKVDSNKLPDVDVNIHEKCGSKLTKADSGKA